MEQDLEYLTSARTYVPAAFASHPTFSPPQIRGSPPQNQMFKTEPRIAIIGAGPGGLTCAISLKEKYGYTNFIIYEKAADVGGTWRNNTYPGCSSDVTMPFYCLSTELRNWKASHLPQPELLAYWVDIANKHDIYPHIVFNQHVTSADWDEAANLYDIQLADVKTGEVSTSKAHIVISAIGVLDTPRYASIPGKESFKGHIFHSARWDDSIDLRGKRICVIGNGASATQFVPLITKDSTSRVVQFCRTQNWMLPSVYKKYSSFRRALFHCFPFLMRTSRWAHFVFFETLYLMIFSNSVTRWALMKFARVFMKLSIPQKYHKNIIPNYDLGCKRIVFDFNYLNALKASNLELNFDGIEKIVEEGIITKKGERLSFDVIIYATGYAADTYPLSIKGRGKKSIQNYFEEHGGPRAYIGTAVPNFPNFFVIFGPNTATGHTSVVFSNECQTNYIMQLLEPIMQGVTQTVEVHADATNEYNDMLQKRLSKSVYSGCSSWYRVGGKGKLSNVFPGASSELFFRLRAPNWSHFSAPGAERWLQKRRRTSMLRSAGRSIIIFAIVLGALHFRLHEKSPPTLTTAMEWISEAGEGYISYIKALIYGSR